LLISKSALIITLMQISRTKRLVISGLAMFAYTALASNLAAQAAPFDTSPAAIAARAAFYSVPGRADLTGPNSPLVAGTKIDFFGDSITWLNGYVSKIQTAINTGATTGGKGIVGINRGDDGAGVLQILNGDPGTTHGYGGVTQQSFATTIASDHPKIAVVFIGVNDVWWRGTSPATFQQGLQDIVSQGKTAGVTTVLTTLAVNGERPDGGNPNDATYDQFAQIARDVAASTHTTLVDLRTAYIDYEMNNNPLVLQHSGPTYLTTGILTYDGIHPTDLGNSLLADQIAEGIYQSLVPEPTSISLLAISCLTLLCRRGELRPRQYYLSK
jgi:lysophospholipase L1-like esterase